MKVRSLRLLVVVTLLTLVVTAVYFVYLPYHHRPHSYRHRSSIFHKIMSPISTFWSNKEVVRIVMANTNASVEMAKEIHKQHGVVLFTMINDAFFDFAASWCCNTAHFSGVHQKVVFLTTDVQTGQRLLSLWPNVSVVAMTSPQFRGSQEYSKAGYVRMMVERTRFIQRLLDVDIRLLLFEVDCVWLSDPLPLLFARQSEGDILATRVSDKNKTAGGFLILNPTVATVLFWRQLTHMMDELFNKLKTQTSSATVSEMLNDQEFFSSLARRRYVGIRIVYLPSDTFPDGKWYSLSAHRRQNSHPVIINNNWVVGIDNKRQRAKSFGHWFWNDLEKKCTSNLPSVHNIYH
ncbi:hypothetical protein ACOMHN_000409 [Nucella lapillus]